MREGKLNLRVRERCPSHLVGKMVQLGRFAFQEFQNVRETL